MDTRRGAGVRQRGTLRTRRTGAGLQQLQLSAATTADRAGHRQTVGRVTARRRIGQPRTTDRRARCRTPPEPLAMPGQRNDGQHRGNVPSDGVYLPSRAWATAAGGAGCIASDAPTLAAWGYRLYGGYVLPADRVAEMTTPIAGDYGLGTAVFTGNPGDITPTADLPVGHSGSIPGYSSEMGVDPLRQISVAVLFACNADQGVDQVFANLLAVLQK